MIDLYICLFLFIGTLAQLISGSLGIYLPLVAVLILYTAVSGGLVRGLVYAVLGGLATDVFAGWGAPWNTFAFLTVAVFARIWCERQMLRPVMVNFLPGLIAAAIQLVFVLVVKVGVGVSWRYLLGTWLPVFVGGLIFGALFLPLAIVILDYFAGRMKLPRYQDARKKLDSETMRWQK